MSTLITSSNRTRAQWDAYIESGRRTPLSTFIAERPHQPVETTAVVIARHAIRPSIFDQVVATDDCGAPILAAGAVVACENT